MQKKTLGNHRVDPPWIPMGDPKMCQKDPYLKTLWGGIPKVDRKSKMKYVFVTLETRIPMWFRKKIHPPKEGFHFVMSCNKKIYHKLDQSHFFLIL